MGYTLIGHFIDIKNKKRIVSAELGFMKNLNSMRYSADFTGIESTAKSTDSDYPDITTYKYTEFQGYYKKEILNEPDFKDKYTIKNDTHRNGVCGYVFDKDFIKANEDAFKKYEANPSLENLINGNAEDFSDFVLLYYRETKNTSGMWYSAKDFKDAEKSIKEEYEKRKSRLDKLNAIKDTKDWFEMSGEAKERLIDEISYVEDDVEDSDWKYWSIRKMNNILDFISNDVGFPYEDETGSTMYKWSYDDNREIEVYIEVD